MVQRSKRIGMMPAEIEAGLKTLEDAKAFLVQVQTCYPPKYDPGAPYGTAEQALNAIAAAEGALIKDAERWR